MYNQDIKEKFVREHPAYSSLLGFFRRSEKTERIYGCDFAEMNSEQIEEILRRSFASVPKKTYLIHFKHWLKKYAAWYGKEKNAYDTSEAVELVFEKINREGPENFFDTKKKIYFHSIKYLILEMNRISADDRSLMHKSAEILAWYGLTDEEITLFKKTDIKKEAVLNRGREIKVDSYSLETLKRFCGLEKYAIAVNGGTGVMYYAESVYLFRRRGRNAFECNRPVSVQSLRCDIAGLFGKSEYNLGLNSTRMNGIMSRAFVKEWEGDVPECERKEYYEKLFEVKMNKAQLENLIGEYLDFKKFISK